MPRIKITNGFPNVGGKGNFLTGHLLNGTLKIGDKLIVEEKLKIPIVEVEILPAIFSAKLIRITIPRDYDNAVIWHTLYGNEFEIENNVK
jgi:hypothetical protein